MYYSVVLTTTECPDMTHNLQATNFTSSGRDSISSPPIKIHDLKKHKWDVVTKCF